MLKAPCFDRPETAYPLERLKEHFTAANITALFNCSCEDFGCLGRGSSAVAGNVVSQILGEDDQDSYISVLGFLFLIGYTGYITKFMEKGYSDKKLRDPTDFADVLELSPSKVAYHRFFSFFLPKFEKKNINELEHIPISSSQILPMEFCGEIADGGYSIVYKARFLPGYHNFPDIYDGLVAVKAYRDPTNASSDCKYELKNNKRYRHPLIMPLLASIDHRGIYMQVYPLAELCLRRLFENDRTPEYNPKHTWTLFAYLFVALSFIHEGQLGSAGYHFDRMYSQTHTISGSTFLTCIVKPHNILVHLGKWVIADLGLAHFKEKLVAGQSSTKKRPGSDEFGGPESEPSRKYDMYSMGCMGCIVMVWLAGGKQAVVDFKKARKHVVDGAKLFNFHSDKTESGLQPGVEDLLSKAEAALASPYASIRNSEIDPYASKLAPVLRRMLSFKPTERPITFEVIQQLEHILGIKLEHVQAEISMPPHEENVSKSNQLISSSN